MIVWCVFMYASLVDHVTSKICCAADLSVYYTLTIMLTRAQSCSLYADMFAAVQGSGRESFFQHYIVFACSNLPSGPGKADQHAHVGRMNDIKKQLRVTHFVLHDCC